MTVKGARPGSYGVTVVLGVTEGSVSATETKLGAGTLRGYIQDRAFTSDHLLALMGKYPHDFPNAASKPANAVESMRGATEVTIRDSDFLDNRSPDDPPRSARIALSYRAGKPELALTIAREMAELVVSSVLNLDQAAVAREQSAAAELLKRSEISLDSAVRDLADAEQNSTDLGVGTVHARRRAEAARMGLRATVATATNARLANRASETSESLRFELIDSGRLPPSRRSWGLLIRDFVAAVLIALLAGSLLAGAFDPRVLDRGDLVAEGLVVLGQVPPLPPSPRKSEGAGRRQSPASWLA